MSEMWHVFRLEELSTITFECSECKTQITFDAEAEIIRQQTRMCPGCNKEIPDVGALLALYRQFYEKGKSKVILKAKG
jgi:NAD-dependent SIR2 family protein deacetylase